MWNFVRNQYCSTDCSRNASLQCGIDDHYSWHRAQTAVWTLYTLLRFTPREQKANNRHWSWLQMESQREASKSNQGSKERWFQSRDRAQPRSGWLQQYINSSFPFEPGTWRIDGTWGKKRTLTNCRMGHSQAWNRKRHIVWYEIMETLADHWAFLARWLFSSACWNGAFSSNLEWCMYQHLL